MESSFEVLEHCAMVSNLEHAIRRRIKSPNCVLLREAKYDWGLPMKYVPDLSILCGAYQTKDQCITDVPRFIAEVLSDKTESVDRNNKMIAYAEAGIEEYWLVDARISGCTIERYMLSDDGNEFILHDRINDKEAEQIHIIVFPSILFPFNELYPAGKKADTRDNDHRGD